MKLLFRLNYKTITMKTINIIKTVAVFLFLGVFIACVQDDDFSVPTDLGVTENLKLQELLGNPEYTELSITELKNQFSTGGANQILSKVYVKGYVVSSDESGNFYKEFYIQDDPTNPTAGIKVVLNMSDTFTKFNFGREVYINLEGLFIGETNSYDGVVALGGSADGSEIGSISVNQIINQVFRSENTMAISPLPVNVALVNNAHVGVFVQLDNMEFTASLAGESYVDSDDSFDSPRIMQSCEGIGYKNFILESSTFADFKNFILPTGNGTIAGIITKDYDGDNIVMALNNTNDVDFSAARCTPLDTNLFTTVFEEDFETANDNSDLDIPNWTNFAEAGGELWTEQVSSGLKYAEFKCSGTGDASNIGWLVSPGIDMDAQTTEFLDFQTAKSSIASSFNSIEVFVSTDYDGANVLAATWDSINANLVTMGDSSNVFVNSGFIDISSYTGTLYVAFKVTGAGTDPLLDGTYRVDNVRVLGM